MDVDFDIFQKILTGLVLGALIGLEREQDVPSKFAGIRTFALFGVLGAIGQVFFGNAFFFWILTGSVFLLIVAAYVTSSLKTKTIGATTELAAMGVYIMGILAGRGEYLLAVSLTLLFLIILHFKNPIHKFVHRVSEEEITSTVKFMIIAFIILPLLPNKTYGPFDVLNPYLIWLMVVFISGISFASYLAIKFLGAKKGIGVTGFFAGLISSTALALSFSQESKKHPGITYPFVFALLIASSAMFFRVLLVLAVLSTDLFRLLVVPFGIMGILGSLLAFSYWKKKEPNKEAELKLQSHTEKLESPFTLRPALKFAVVFAIILFLTKIALRYFGSEGLYLTSFLSGILDVDAITVSLAKLSEPAVSLKIISLGIFIAAVTNTLSKGVIVFLFGNKQVARPLFLVYLAMIATGGIVLALL